MENSMPVGLRLALTAAMVCLFFGCSTLKRGDGYYVYPNAYKKISGHNLLYVEASRLDTVIQPRFKPNEIDCGVQSFPITMASSFEIWTKQTLPKLVQSLQEVAAPVSGSELFNRNAERMITVQGENVIGRFEKEVEFGRATIEAELTLIASVTVEDQSGRLLRSVVEGKAAGQAAPAFVCSGRSEAFQHLWQPAIEDAVRRISQDLANSQVIPKI